MREILLAVLGIMTFLLGIFIGISAERGAKSKDSACPTFENTTISNLPVRCYEYWKVLK